MIIIITIIMSKNSENCSCDLLCAVFKVNKVKENIQEEFVNTSP